MTNEEILREISKLKFQMENLYYMRERGEIERCDYHPMKEDFEVQIRTLENQMK